MPFTLALAALALHCLFFAAPVQAGWGTRSRPRRRRRLGAEPPKPATDTGPVTKSRMTPEVTARSAWKRFQKGMEAEVAELEKSKKILASLPDKATREKRLRQLAMSADAQKLTQAGAEAAANAKPDGPAGSHPALLDVDGLAHHHKCGPDPGNYNAGLMSREAIAKEGPTRRRSVTTLWPTAPGKWVLEFCNYVEEAAEATGREAQVEKMKADGLRIPRLSTNVILRLHGERGDALLLERCPAQAPDQSDLLMLAWLPLAAAANLLWQAVAPGVWRAEAPMARSGALAPVRVTMLRLTRRRSRFELRTATRDFSLRGAWTVDSLPPEAVAAFNAGQFETDSRGAGVYGRGREELPPGTGPLSMAFIVDAQGRVTLMEASALEAYRSRATLAFQSYPAVPKRSELPWQLRDKGRGADIAHRDSRLALGVRDDGQLIVAPHAVHGLGPAGEQLPWGPTAPEMAQWMQSLGCRRAMLLDGGMSSQMAIRRRDGSIERWRTCGPCPWAGGAASKAPSRRANACPAAKWRHCPQQACEPIILCPAALGWGTPHVGALNTRNRSVTIWPAFGVDVETILAPLEARRSQPYAGLLLNYAALALSDRHAGRFPAVHDIVLDQLPFVDLAKYGEIFLTPLPAGVPSSCTPRARTRPRAAVRAGRQSSMRAVRCSC